MKKFMLALLAAGTMATANAQTNSWLLYGDVNYHSTSISGQNTSSTNWSATPGIGYQFTKNWTAGLNLNWGQSATNDTGYKATVNNYEVGVFGRYANSCFGSSIFSWYGQLNIGYAGTYSTSGNLPSYDKASGIHIFLFPAVAASLGHGWALNFAIGGLGYETQKPTNGNAVNQFDFNFGQEMTFGISKNIGGHMHGHHHMGDDTRESNMSDDNDDNSNSGHHHHHHKKAEDNDGDE